MSGLNAAVSGAGTGFGQAFAAALALAGATVHLFGRRAEMLDATIAAAAQLGADPELLRPHPADLRDPGACARALSEAAASGPLNAAVANAAVPQNFGGATPLLDAGEEDWARMIDTNVTSQWRFLRSVARDAGPAGLLRALAITSEAGWADTPRVGPYNVSKAALNGLTMSLAAECAAAFPAADIQMNGLIPGEARTEMNQGSTDSPWTAVPMALVLLSHPPGGPNGRFFYRDGRHFDFAYAKPWHLDLQTQAAL